MRLPRNEALAEPRSPRDPVIHALHSSVGGLTVQAKYGPSFVAARARAGLEDGPKSWKAKARAAAGDEVLTDSELARRADLLRRAHIAKMTARSVAARRAKAAERNGRAA